MTTPDTENSDPLLTQTNPAETKKKNIRFAVALYVACVFGGVLVSGWQKTLAGFSVVPITTLGFQLGVALGPFVFGWLIAKGASLALKNVSFNTVWTISAAIWMLLGFYGRQSAEISTAAGGGNTVQVQPTAKKEVTKSGDAETCSDAGKKIQWSQALPACTAAAKRGDSGAQFYLANMYENGVGVAQDYEEAVRWYTLAAEQGLAGAQYGLGDAYRNGRGVVQDYAQAMAWFKMAAAQGLAEAQHKLGLMYSRGQGVAQDDVRAHMWFNLAAVSGAALSIKIRDVAASKMTQEQISEAQRMARDCTAKNYKAC